MISVFALLAFFALLIIIELIFWSFSLFNNPDQKTIRNRLGRIGTPGSYSEPTDITRKHRYSDVLFIDNIITKTPFLKRLDTLLEQADTQFPLGVFILWSLLLGVSTFLGVNRFIHSPIYAIAGALLLGLMPWLYLRYKRNKRIRSFQHQMPDAVDLLARAMRAGHAFTTGMKFVADEFDKPLGSEFQLTLDEINFGVGVGEALKRLAGRVGSPELGVFVVSVILQRETGGNLSEILVQLGTILRERFKLQGKIVALTGEGRITALILFAIPFFIMFILYIMKPDVFAIMFENPTGRMLSLASIVSMVFGYLVIRRMLRLDI